MITFLVMSMISMGFYKDLIELLWGKKEKGTEMKDIQIRTKCTYYLFCSAKITWITSLVAITDRCLADCSCEEALVNIFSSLISISKGVVSLVNELWLVCCVLLV